MKSTFLFCANKKEKYLKKVWEKGVEFEVGKKHLSLKGLFPLLKYRLYFKQFISFSMRCLVT